MHGVTAFETPSSSLITDDGAQENQNCTTHLFYTIIPLVFLATNTHNSTQKQTPEQWSAQTDHSNEGDLRMVLAIDLSAIGELFNMNYGEAYTLIVLCSIHYITVLMFNKL